MENINLNSILKRDTVEAEMMSILKDMEETDTLLMKRCIFIHGDPGIGKTTFVINALKAGANVVTIPANILDQMFKHPLTDIGYSLFKKDLESL